MEWHQVWAFLKEVPQLIWSVLASLAASSAFIALTSKSILESYKSKLNKDLESHKSELASNLERHKSELALEADRSRLIIKRQELLFADEMKAASEFFRYYDQVLTMPSSPDADWSDGQIIIAESFGEHEKGLTQFIRDHGTSISDGALKLIERARSIANQGTFAVGEDTRGVSYKPNETPGADVCKLADNFWEVMTEAKNLIRSEIKTGTFGILSKK